MEEWQCRYNVIVARYDKHSAVLSSVAGLQIAYERARGHSEGGGAGSAATDVALSNGGLFTRESFMRC